jgi:hypothetical protein
MDWCTGHINKHAIVTHLFLLRIASKHIIPIDSIIVNAIFGQQARKARNHRHDILQLSLDASVDNETRKNVYTAFEAKKKQLDMDNPLTYLQTADDIAKAIYNVAPEIRLLGEDSYDVLAW